MTRLIKLTALALALAAFTGQLSTALAQGALTPPGAPAPMMKSLAQIQPQTPISTAPFTISNSGSFYLTTNLTSVSNAIVITASGVTLDLAGFTIFSSASNAINGGAAILLTGQLKDITIANGHICSGVTNNGSGFYSGPGFAQGIELFSGNAANIRVSGVSVSGVRGTGIYLVGGNTFTVDSCVVRTAAGNGINASVIRNCEVTDCYGYAIVGDQVADCRGESIGNGAGVFATATAANCHGTAQNDDGINAQTVQNCYGESYAGYGIRANVAVNSFGYSNGSDGIHAYRTAQNCYGSSINGTGLYAQNASFCTADRSGGTAIQATVATGCCAQSGTNSVTYKYNMP